MGLLDFFKGGKKPKDGEIKKEARPPELEGAQKREDVPEAKFLFRIDDVFQIKGRGLVLTGQVLRGSIKTGDQVAFGTPTLRELFPCIIGGIEHPDAQTNKIMQVDCADKAGPYQASYGILIPDREPRLFRKGYYLFIR